MEARFTPVGDHALLVSFATEVSEGAHQTVFALDKALADDPPQGMTECVPALVNLLVDFDPIQTDHHAVEAAVRERIGTLQVTALSGTQIRVQVCYDTPEFAPDLAAVAQQTGLSEEAVIDAHMNGDYRALMYGFSPGYAYLTGVPDNIQVPRKSSAIRDIPAGSVLIAGQQTIVTTLTMPTGWCIIGRSPTRILTGDPGHPFLFDVGDTVTFERITRAEFDRLHQGARDG